MAPRRSADKEIRWVPTSPSLSDEVLELDDGLEATAFSCREYRDRSLIIAPDAVVDRCRFERAQITSFDLARNARIRRSEFIDSEFDALFLDSVKLDQLLFANSRLLGLRLHNAVVQDCQLRSSRLDYASFSGLTGRGPLVFFRSTLKEATFTRCSVDTVLFVDCDLTSVEFQECSFKRIGLAGDTRLTGVVGLNGMKHVSLSESLEEAFIAAVMAQLGVTTEIDTAALSESLTAQI